MGLALVALALGGCSAYDKATAEHLDRQGQCWAQGDHAIRPVTGFGRPETAVRIDTSSCSPDQTETILAGAAAWHRWIALDTTTEPGARGDGAVICVDELPGMRAVLWGEIYLLPTADATIAAHEFGHLVGLDHLPGDTLMGVPAVGPDPSQADLDALVELYPALH